MKLSARDSALLAVLAVIVLASGLWYVLVRPASSELDAARAELVPITAEATDLREQLARLAGEEDAPAIDAAARLRTAKAVPDRTAAPGTLVQLERLASRANVSLDSVKTTSATLYGGYVGTEYELRVVGSFFDVDDFMYRLHRQVEVNERATPTVTGRLFATTAVDMTPLDAESGMEGGEVTAVVRVVAFSVAPPGAAGAVPGATPPATAAPATTPVAGEATPPAPAPADPAATEADPVDPAANPADPTDTDPAADPADGTTTSTGAQG